MTTSAAPPSLPYHRLARLTGRHRWWRPPLGLLFLGVGWLLLIGCVDTVVHVVGEASGRAELPDGSIDLGQLPNAVLELSYIALMLPAVLLAVRWVGRRPAGTVSSVAGRLRWRWTARCLSVAAPAAGLLTVVSFFLPADDTESAAPGQWVGLTAFLGSLAVLAVFVPLQATAEEYVFRGWLLQAVGGFLRSPWCAVVPQAALFAAAHGWGTPWGFADLLVFGLVTGWLTVRTGGLEASVALHVLTNMTGFGVAAAVVDGLASDETAADLPWPLACADMAVTLLYAAAVLWLARRNPPQRLAAPPRDEVVHPPSPYAAAHYPAQPASPAGPYAAPAAGPYGPHPAGPYAAPPAGPYGPYPPGPYAAPPAGPYGSYPAGPYAAPATGPYAAPATGPYAAPATGPYAAPASGPHDPHSAGPYAGIPEGTPYGGGSVPPSPPGAVGQAQPVDRGEDPTASGEAR